MGRMVGGHIFDSDNRRTRNSLPCRRLPWARAGRKGVSRHESGVLVPKGKSLAQSPRRPACEKSLRARRVNRGGGGFIAAALPVFRQQGFGHFVNTASTAGIVIKPTMGGLCRHEVRRARRVNSASLLQERQQSLGQTNQIDPPSHTW